MPDSMPSQCRAEFSRHSNIYFRFFSTSFSKDPLRRQQYGRTGCIPFHRLQHDVQGASFILSPPHAVWTCRVYPFQPRQRSRRAGCICLHRQWARLQSVPLYTACSVDEQDVSMFTASSVDLQGVSLSTVSSVLDVQNVSLSTFVQMF